MTYDRAISGISATTTTTGIRNAFNFMDDNDEDDHQLFFVTSYSDFDKLGE